MIKDKIHEAILKNMDPICKWYTQKAEGLEIPFYSSFDIRDSGNKIATVDANVFPAGFNNICQVDKDAAPELIRDYVKDGVKKILLFTEAHTNNLFYWDNVATIEGLLKESGFETRVCVPIADFAEQEIESASGRKVQVLSFQNLGGYEPDLVISNNDFTEPYADWGGSYTFNPPRELGWHSRRKDSYFNFYNELVEEFAGLLSLDPSHFLIETSVFKGLDLGDEESKSQLGQEVDAFLSRLTEKYTASGFGETPFAFIKNSSGTYGLGILPVQTGDDVRSMSYKSRKKMKAAKGGGGVSEVIIQEGIPSAVEFEDGVAEPVIYMVGTELAGGFLRTHRKKGVTESLNSPGAVYERLCLSDLKINSRGCPLENVYGWLAKIGALAIGREAAQ